MISPELPTQQEQKAIDRMVDADIDFSIENRHIHEVVSEDAIDVDESDA